MVCREAYDDETHCPRIVKNCGHILCEKCIKKIIEEKWGIFSCPTCRREVECDAFSNSEFLKNHELISILEVHKLAPSLYSKDTRTCPEHKSIAEIVCKDCMLFICSKCFIIKHKSHQITHFDDIKEDISKKENTINFEKKRVEDILSKVTKFIDDSLTDLEIALNKKLREYCEELTRVITERKDTLAKEISTFRETLKQELFNEREIKQLIQYKNELDQKIKTINDYDIDHIFEILSQDFDSKVENFKSINDPELFKDRLLEKVQGIDLLYNPRISILLKESISLTTEMTKKLVYDPNSQTKIKGDGKIELNLFKGSQLDLNSGAFILGLNHRELQNFVKNTRKHIEENNERIHYLEIDLSAIKSFEEEITGLVESLSAFQRPKHLVLVPDENRIFADSGVKLSYLETLSINLDGCNEEHIKEIIDHFNEVDEDEAKRMKEISLSLQYMSLKERVMEMLGKWISDYKKLRKVKISFVNSNLHGRDGFIKLTKKLGELPAVEKIEIDLTGNKSITEKDIAHITNMMKKSCIEVLI